MFVIVQLRIFKKRTKINEKTTKRAREMEKSQKPRPGKQMVKVELKMTNQSFMIQEMTRMTLLLEFEEITRMVLQLSENVKFGPLKNILKKVTSETLHESKMAIMALGSFYENWQLWSLQFLKLQH